MSVERLKEVAFAQDTNLGAHETDESDVKEWGDYFFDRASRVLNPCDSRLEWVNQKNEPVRFYSLILQTIEGITKRIQNHQSAVRLHLTFFDITYKQFFGLTWKGPGRVAIDNINYDEHVFFCSSISDDHILCVIELVEKMPDKKSVTCGWTAFRPFMATSNAELNKRLPIYAGTPRALLFIDDPFEKFKDLVELQGLYLTYSFTEKPRLDQVRKYLPENVFLGRLDRIGGILENHPKHCLDKPRLAPQLSIIIDDLFVYLNPNVTRFESELTQLLAEDKSLWDKIKIEPSMISIFERRLKIGVHNGWRFLHEPYIVQLGVDDPALSKSSLFQTNRRLSLKTSLKPKPGDHELNMQAARLVMRNSIVLNEVFEDPLCAIVFIVEYIVNIPIQYGLESESKNKKDQKSMGGKKQVETHHIVVRWGVFCPYASGLNEDVTDGRMEINMFGASSEGRNPENRLVFKRPDTDMQDEYSSRMAPGRISFNIRKGTHVNFKQPKFDDSEPIESRQPISRYDDLSKKMLHQTQTPDFNPQTQRSINDLYSSMMSRTDDNFQSPQGNLLMSQLQHQMMMKSGESQRLLGVFGGNLELYPVYNPSFHMPILALAPGQMGGRTMSRAAYAKLQSAKFPPILDRFGKQADVIEGSTFIRFDLQKEEADNLTCNQIIFQFLAFSRTLESMRENSEPRPKNIYFTFQFYRFPEFKTPKLKLDKIMEDYSMDSYSTPFVLKHVELDRNGSSESPGYMISYSVDPTNLKFGEKRMFLEYLANHAMFIDVWDGDSLHLIGSATLQLKELLRQGKEAVQSTFELDVISVEYDDDSRLYSGNTFKDGAAFSSDSHVKLRGLLHMRIGNIGSPVTDPSDPINQTSLAPYLPFTRVIASKTSLNSMGQQLLTKKIDEMTPDGFLSHQISRAHHMAETFKDIHAAIAAQNNKNIADSSNPSLDALRRRKLHRMEMVRKGQVPLQLPEGLGYHKRFIEERKKDLRIMEFYRNQTKQDQIMNKLHEFITTEYAIYPNFGIVEFFEFVLTNPYNQAQTVTIIMDDPDIQVVTDSREWRHLKLLHQIYTSVEDNMFHRENTQIVDDKSVVKYPQIYMRPKETINIPFKYQTFRADHRAISETTPIGYQQQQVGKTKYEIKKIQVYFRAEDFNPIAILRLIVDQQPHVVNQTFRFNECENSYLKKTIRLPGSTKVLASNATAILSGDIKIDGTMVDHAQTQLYVRTSDPNVICESRAVTVGEPHDVYFKAPTGSAPSVKKFYLAIYADQYLAVPLQIWQIYIHALQRIDISCSLGQTSRFSLILKGSQSSRLVKAFSSSPDEMSIVPEDKFMLAASAVQEINAGVQPIRTGLKHFYLNVVDVEQSSLVHSWFINVNCKPPVITKSFEVTVPVATSSSMPTIKRVSYTNSYATEKVFILATNRDDLLTFKERRLKSEFNAGEQKTLSLRFLPNAFTGFVEIYVFINNENDINEETFALRVHYVKQAN